MTQGMLQKVRASLCGAHYHIQVLTQSIPRVNIILYFTKCDDSYARSSLSKGDASWAPFSSMFYMKNIFSMNPRAYRLRDTHQFSHFTYATPMLHQGYSI